MLIDSLTKMTMQASCGQSVLEIGCGGSKYLNRTTCKTKVGIDACRSVLQSGKKDGNILIHLDLMKFSLTDFFLDNNFDTIMGIDVIEHFEKFYGIELVKECEAVARSQVLFFVPVGNHPQVKDVTGFDNDYFQTHRSAWHPKDMESLGYTVHYIEKYHHEPGKDPGAMFCWKFL